ncbi:MAG: signal recognition particle-docking protein FtsY [Hyphomicrobiales bacterium]
MSFFKKLFNRITGKKDEAAAAAPELAEQAALPAPEEEPEIPSADDRAPVLEPVVAAGPVVETVTLKTAPKKAAPPPPKKTAAQEPAAKKKAAPEKKPAASKARPVKAPAAKAAPAPKPKAAPFKVAVKAPVAPPQPPPPAPQPIPSPVPEPTAQPVPPPVFAPEPMPAALPPAPQTVQVPEARRSGWFSRLRDGLSKSSKSITGSITAIFTKRKLDAETLQDLEDTLIQADLGIAVSERIIKAVATGRYDKEIDPEEVKQILAQEVAAVLKPVEVPFNFGTEKPFVILVVGVNGSGKTTTIGKLGAIAAREGFKVKFAACDTFRAAAIEQLSVWGQRIGAETIARPPGSDAAGLAFDAMKAAQADGTDILFIDTAGRLHNKTYLMDELDKVVRVIKKYDEKAPHAVLLVLDATTGQNALAQAEAFTKVAGVTGLIMTKLDGTARGGILVAIAERFKLPVHAIGVGESIDDLQPFDASAFARAIAGLDTEMDGA